MAVRYYDDAIAEKLKKWIPDNSTLRILKPDETKRLFELRADDSKDGDFKLPVIALSRNNDIEILRTNKDSRGFDGLRIKTDQKLDSTKILNSIPIKVEYKLDIYTKTYEEGDEYIRNFVFKLINNPVLYVSIPYNNSNLSHIANIRLLSTISDTSSISERIFTGQFTRWTIQFELQDAFLFNIPYKSNWHFGGAILETEDKSISEPIDCQCQDKNNKS